MEAGTAATLTMLTSCPHTLIPAVDAVNVDCPEQRFDQSDGIMANPCFRLRLMCGERTNLIVSNRESTLLSASLIFFAMNENDLEQCPLNSSRMQV